MPIRSVLLVPVFAAAAFACLPMPYDGQNLAARTSCVLPPGPVPVEFTIVRGDVDAYVVSEFEHPIPGACDEIVVDSVTRGVPSPSLVPVPKLVVDYGVATGTGAVTVHWRTLHPERDLASVADCAKIRRTRVVTAIPRLYSPNKIYPPIVLPADSVFECHDGYCTRMPRRVVDNAIPAEQCMEGLAAPAPSRDAAMEYIRGRLEASGTVYRLTKSEITIDPVLSLYIACPRPEPLTISDTFADPAPVLKLPVIPFERQETRIVVDNGFYTQWPALGAWNDTAVSADLAIPSPGNAGDRFESENLRFQVNYIRPTQIDRMGRSVNIRTGIKRYEYIGRQISLRNFCGPTLDLGPTIVGDTLRLDGASIRLTNEGCSRRGIDVFAGKYSDWLVSPSVDQTLGEAMWHGSSIENGTSWPIDGDSILVRGWNLPLEDVLGIATSVDPTRIRKSGFSARLVGTSLAIASTRSGTVEVLSATGRTLVRRDVAAGDNTLQIPVGTRGMLLVRSAEGAVKILAH